jgi:hypothetical protein
VSEIGLEMESYHAVLGENANCSVLCNVYFWQGGMILKKGTLGHGKAELYPGK